MVKRPGIDPLAPESLIGFCSGLLTGSGALFSGRFMVVGKSPLTGGRGGANAGGHLSQQIKKAGYDAVFFTGEAKYPVWVYITHESIEIRDASFLWGKDTVETQEIIREILRRYGTCGFTAYYSITSMRLPDGIVQLMNI